MITNSYLQKKKYPSSNDRMSSRPSSSFKDKPFLHNSNISEPLKTISHDLSFKGSSVNKKEVEEALTIAEALATFTKEFGESAAEHLRSTIDNVTSKTNQSGIKKVGDKLEFAPETTGKKVKDILLYPVVKMPVDMAMGALETFKKIPGLKESKTLEKMLNADMFSKRRDEIKLLSDSAAIQNLFENAKGKEKPLKVFETAHGRIKPSVSNYSSMVERSMTRFVTGMIPAFFLANDAYNLSMYMKNNKTDAKEEKRRRFNQETARILVTTAFTYGSLAFFAKKSNSSGKATNLIMIATTATSEFLGRILAGNPVLPVSASSAKKYADKRAKDKEENHKVDNKKSSGSFKGNEAKTNETKANHNPPEEGLLTFKNVVKAWIGLMVFGFGIEKAQNNKTIKGQLTKFSEQYDSYFQKDKIISREKYNELTAKLREDNKFTSLANKYDEIIKDQKGDTINLGKSTIKWKDTLVNKILLYPFKFAWNSLIMLPHKLTKTAIKEIVNIEAFQKAFGIKEAKKVPTADSIKKDAEEKQAKKLEMLKNSLAFLKKIDGASDYTEKVNTRLMEGLDNVTKSNFSAADESATIRTTMQAVTSGFLIADSYNMVMIDSQGKDSQLAEQKAKERTLQRTVRMAYGALIQKAINGVFKTQYDASLVGAQLVNTANTFATESLERVSVGLPIGESTKDEIVAKEQANLSATGIKGAYFRAMAKLTGKKALSERAAKKEEKKA